MMRKINILFILMATILTSMLVTLSSCGKDSPLKQLAGSWNLTGIFVDGAGQSGSGDLRFNGDMTGNLDIVYFLNDTLQVTTAGGFFYQPTNSEVVFNPGEIDEFIWQRNDDQRDEQEFEFDQAVDNVNYNVVLEFTR